MKWTEEETELLKNNIDKSINELLSIFNRTKDSISRKIFKLNLYEIHKNNLFLRKEELELKRREKISATCKINKKSGGLRKGSGRGKKGTYKGYWCDSSYELAWVIYHIDHNIKFTRNLEKFPYYFNNELKNYIPDFIIDNTYFEIKGYKDEKVDLKIEYFPFELKLLYTEDLKEIFEYVITNYGKNFISLYEEKIYKEKKCSICSKDICEDNKSGICKSCINNSDNKVKKEIKKKDKINKKICNCGGLKSRDASKCIKCVKEDQYNKKPKLEVLLEDIKKLGYCGTGRKYGISDTMVRKWVKNIIKYENGNRGSVG